MPTLAERLREEGRNEVKEKWIYEAKREIARRMLNEDFPIEQIVKLTRLTEEEVRRLLH